MKKAKSKVLELSRSSSSKKNPQPKLIEHTLTKFKLKERTYTPPKLMTWRLYIDCTHNPPSTSYNSGWIVARSFTKAAKLIKLYGFPKHVRYGVIHEETRDMSFLAHCLIRWALKTKQRVNGRVTWDTTASMSIVSKFKIEREYKVWFKKAYDNE